MLFPSCSPARAVSNGSGVGRNDNNIRIGDTDELFYRKDKNGWISLGRQKARDIKLTFHDIPNKALFLLLYLSPDKEIEYLRSTGTRNRSGSNSGKRPPGKPDTIRREKAFYVSRADSCRPESMKNAERLSLRKCKP